MSGTKGNGSHQRGRDLVQRFFGWALLFCSGAVGAQDIPSEQCVANPQTPDIKVTVPGFPGERLYLHRKHPRSCKAEGGNCVATAYVVANDRLLVTKPCEGWSFASFTAWGRTTTTTGWVASRRLPYNYDRPEAVLTVRMRNTAGPVRSRIPACSEAQTRLNEAVQRDLDPMQALPEASVSKQEVSELPEGVWNGQFWSAAIANATVQGRALKVVSFGAGGTCHDKFVQLWDPEFREQIVIDDQFADESDSFEGYTSEALVRLGGGAFFAHFGRDAWRVRLYGFDKDLSARSVCHLTLVTPVDESVRFAAEPKVCGALLARKVSGAPIDDIEPVPLTEEALAPGLFTPSKSLAQFGEYRLVSRGRVDVDNDNQQDSVGIVEYDGGSSSGCGEDYHAMWPVKLDANGMPAGVPFNQQSVKVAGDNDDSRLFTFRGATYFERRTRPGAQSIPVHEVWRFTPAGPVQACVFNAALYDATDFDASEGR